MVNEKGEEVGIIYGWYNTLTDMWYVGQTINPEERFKAHIKSSKNRHNTFYRAIRKYGLNNFVYCILEENVLRENLSMREMDWIEEYDSFYNGYNETLGGEGWCGYWLGKHRSEETKKKLSEKIKGQHYGYWKGKHLTSETIEKLKEVRKGRIPWNKGKRYTYTEEEKARIYASRRGRPSWNKGIPMTEEAKRKSSESHKKKTQKSKEDISL